MTVKRKDTKWLNLYSLSEALLKTNQELMAVKFFSSKIKRAAEKQSRQWLYWQALEEVGVKITPGHFQPNDVVCRNCKIRWLSHKEKMTDVNMATAIFEDAFQDAYDAALIISGDSDFVAPIKAIYRNFENKRVVVAFPPNRTSVYLKKIARSYFTIGRKNLKDHQLPLEITKADGYTLHKPKEWY